MDDWCEEGLPAAARRHLQSLTMPTGSSVWEAHLDALGISSVRHWCIAAKVALRCVPIE
jgi:hypothetical protein